MAIFAWDQTGNAFYLHHILSKKLLGIQLLVQRLREEISYDIQGNDKLKTEYFKNHDIWKAAEYENVLQY